MKKNSFLDLFTFNFVNKLCWSFIPEIVAADFFLTKREKGIGLFIDDITISGGGGCYFEFKCPWPRQNSW